MSAWVCSIHYISLDTGGNCSECQKADLIPPDDSPLWHKITCPVCNGTGKMREQLRKVDNAGF